MPGRDEPFLNNGIYHVFDRTIDSRKVFQNQTNASEFLNILKYYRSLKANVSFSRYKNLDFQLQKSLLFTLQIKKYFMIEILAFCLMPTHFHILLRQRVEGGVSKYMATLLNSFTRFFNSKNKRKGPIFFPRFRSVSVQTDEQMIHTSRYIHLNPYSSGVIKHIKDLENYKYSSFIEYINKGTNSLCETESTLNYFNNDRSKYKDFVIGQAEYQKTLEILKYMDKWM